MPLKQGHKGIVIFGLIEIAIGLVTLTAVISSLILGKSTKPLSVLVFVITASGISLGLGIGILRRNLTSYHFLLFFSSIIILSKILILTKIITLSGELETSISADIKSLVSICYHSLLIFYFVHSAVKKEFGEKRNVLFSLKMPFKR